MHVHRVRVSGQIDPFPNFGRAHQRFFLNAGGIVKPTFVQEDCLRRVCDRVHRFFQHDRSGGQRCGQWHNRRQHQISRRKGDVRRCSGDRRHHSELHDIRQTRSAGFSTTGERRIRVVAQNEAAADARPGEIHDDVGAFPRRQQKRRQWNRSGGKKAQFHPEHPKRQVAAARPFYFEIIEPGLGTVHHPEPIAARFHIQERESPAVHHRCVAEEFGDQDQLVVVPIPAPVLLAGLGLLGVGVLRRRYAK